MRFDHKKILLCLRITKLNEVNLKINALYKKYMCKLVYWTFSNYKYADVSDVTIAEQSAMLKNELRMLAHIYKLIK